MMTVDKGGLLRPEQHHLQHHVVRQQDMRTFNLDALLVRIALLSGVLCEADWHIVTCTLFIGEPHRFERLKLAVHERVHRVDHDSPDTLLGMIAAEDCIEDRDKVGQAFTGAGTARDDVGLLFNGGSANWPRAYGSNREFWWMSTRSLLGNRCRLTSASLVQFEWTTS